MNSRKLLQAKGDELSRLLGEVLHEGPHEHKTRLAKEGNQVGYLCEKCGEFQSLEEWELENWECKYADPIPLDDWNVAMRWRDLAVRKCGIIEFGRVLEEVFNSNGKVLAGCFHIYSYVQREDILIASAICILKGK